MQKTGDDDSDDEVKEDIEFDLVESTKVRTCRQPEGRRSWGGAIKGHSLAFYQNSFMCFTGAGGPGCLGSGD